MNLAHYADWQCLAHLFFPTIKGVEVETAYSKLLQTSLALFLQTSNNLEFHESDSNSGRDYWSASFIQLVDVEEVIWIGLLKSLTIYINHVNIIYTYR